MYGKKKKKYLKGGQAKLDMNKDGKLSGADFKMLGNKNKKMMMGGKMNADKDFMYGGKMMKKMARGGTFEKVAEKRDDMMMRFKGFTGTSGSGIPKQDKPARRRKKMMKGGKMRYGSGGYHQHD